MFSVSFFVVSKDRKIITGGHKYDNDLYTILEGMEDLDTSKVEVGCKPGTPILLKLAKETVKGFKASHKQDLIIFNSSVCFRFLLMLILIRIFRWHKRIYTIHHHFLYLEFKGLKRFIYKYSELFFLKLSNKIIVPSPYIYEELKKIRREKDLLLWRIPFDTKQNYPPSPKQGFITFAGTIEPRKGLIYLLQALNIVKKLGIKYHLDILGKPINEAYYKILKEYAETQSLDLTFHGFVSKEVKNKILSESDLFVFPSLLEGFGMVLIEAQVYGLPIVSFDNSAMPFTVKNYVNGFTVPTGNIQEMADKIAIILVDRPLRERLSKEAYQNIKSQWSFEKFETTVMEYFTKLIELKSNSK